MAINDIGSGADGLEESGISMGNISEGISESYKEEVKKGEQKFKRTKKDEQKAKQQDMLLAKYLVKILINKSYDSLLPDLFKTFDSGIPSNLILGIMSLVYIDISNSVRDNIGKNRIHFQFYSEETMNFSGDALPKEVKDRINGWVEDIHAIIVLNPSKVYTARIIGSISKSQDLYVFSEKVLIYFLSEINIYITEKVARGYIKFILKEIILPKIKT